MRSAGHLVVLVADGDPGVVGDDPLVQGEDGLVTSLQPAHLQHNTGLLPGLRGDAVGFLNFDTDCSDCDEIE